MEGNSWPTVGVLLRDKLRLAAAPRRAASLLLHSWVNVGVNAFTGTDGANWPQLRIELPCINSREWPVSVRVSL